MEWKAVILKGLNVTDPPDPKPNPEEKIGPFAPLKVRDFRLLWIGAFSSFIGSWVQTVAQGWLVYDITGDEQKLAWVTFCAMAPVALFAPFAGTLADTLNRRTVLIAAQLVFGINALILAISTHLGRIRYEEILVIALINGFVSTIEMPARQSLVSTVVPKELLSRAIPIQASTFNMARVVGPAVGGIMLAKFGAQSCYLFNSISYLAMVFGVVAIRADLTATAREVMPIRDLLTEGILYTWREPRLKALFWMESIVSAFGLAYIPLIPAFAKDVLKVNAIGLSQIYTAVGIGAISALGTLLWMARFKVKGWVVAFSVTGIGLGLLLLSTVRNHAIALPIFALIGFCTVLQFNTTNTLFQTIAPQNLRGRVLAMHVWAISGSAPILLPFFGWLSYATSVPMAMTFGSVVVCLAALLIWTRRPLLRTLNEI